MAVNEILASPIVRIGEAIVLLILAFIVAAIVRGLIRKLLGKTRLAEADAKANEGTDNKPKMTLAEFIAQLIYLIVFLLFIPGIFSVLGISPVSEPIMTFLYSVWGYVPNILAAVIVLVVGTLIAKLVRQLLIPVFEKLRVNKLQEKAGMEVTDEGKLSNTLAYIVYVLILIPVVIAALEALSLDSISAPAVEMLNIVLGFIPNIVAALLLIWIGAMIGRFTGGLVKQLISSTGFDQTVRRLIGEEKFPKFVFSAVVGMVVRVVIDIFFIVQGVSVLKLEVLDTIGSAVIGYLPSVLAAVLILIGAFLLASAADKALEKNGLKQYAIIARVAILVVAAFMVLNQLGIAITIVNAAFILIVAALAVAFAIAFGIGGREFAKKQLSKLDDALDQRKKDN